jgi:hypothetical protein
VASVVVLAAVVGFVAIPPIAKEYPVTLTASERIAGMPKSHDESLAQLADHIASQLQSRGGGSSTIASFYAPDGDNEHMVAVVAMAKLFLSPSSEITTIFREVSSDELTVSDVREMPAGKQRGVVECGSGKIKSEDTEVPISMCAWADYGSAGLGIFFNRSVDESAPLFVTIRSQVAHHA